MSGRWRWAGLVLGLGTVMSLAEEGRAQGTPVGFEESFALAADREAALDQLVPGTPEFYYYHCLHHQHRGELDAVAPLLETWIERHGRGGQTQEIELRQAMLSYDVNPKSSLETLRRHLGLSFDHQRELDDAERELPTALDPAALSWPRLRDRQLAGRKNDLQGFTDQAMPLLVGADLTPRQRSSLLERLRWHDAPNLASMIVRDLSRRESGGWRSRSIHDLVTLEVLEECARLRPELLQQSEFVHAWIERLKPSADVDLAFDDAARRAYLERLDGFTERLGAPFSSLRAHVLYHRLQSDQRAGVVDRELLLNYLRLPSSSRWANPEYVRRITPSVPMVDRSGRFNCGLNAIETDDSLVRESLAACLRQDDSMDAYAPFVQQKWLRQLFAEVKILAGEGDMEKWYSLLDDPAEYERIKERVELQFPPTQPRFHAIDAPVTLEVDVKHVDTLLVKVFELDTLNYHRDRQREVDASIDLDGLVAGKEMTFRYDEGPFRRVRRTFEFPSIDHAGVFVVEFIGNGVSSRAVVRKGRLRMLERVGSAGHVLRVLDETNRVLPEASVWLGGREFTADEDGDIVVPFATDSGRKKLVLSHGRRSTLVSLDHLAESYELRAGVFLDRESLIPGRRARLVVRPSFTVHGALADPSLLEDPVLSLISVDHFGVRSTQEVRDIQWSRGEDFVHEVQVPVNLASLSVQLKGSVRLLSSNVDTDLTSETQTFVASRIASTDQVSAPLLQRTRDGYTLELRGKNGEVRAGRVVELHLRHRLFREPVRVTLETDDDGRISLGRLDDVLTVHAPSLPGGLGTWPLTRTRADVPPTMHGLSGRALSCALPRSVDEVTRDEFALVELRGGAPAVDRFSHLSLDGGRLVLGDLPAGDYRLWVDRFGRPTTVRVTEGAARDGWAIGSSRQLRLSEDSPMAVASLEAKDAALEVRLTSADRDARVHVFSSRYVTPYDPFDRLHVTERPTAWSIEITPPESTFHSGRAIGDEYRYILDRREAKTFAGTMMQRPGLLLNPWAVEETHTAIGAGGGSGGAFGGRAGAARSRSGRAGRPESDGRGPNDHPGTFPDLSFLPVDGTLLTNLRPDEHGVVRVPWADLGGGSQVHVLALDGRSTSYRTVARADRPLTRRDRRHEATLDPARHYTETRSITMVDSGETVVVDDPATSKIEPYDSLESVFRLFRTLSGNADLEAFSFILRWPTMDEEAKRDHYGRFACHELHLFVFEKDRDFFDRVVRPHLAQKMEKTFLDQWLLGDDLTGYLEPWAFGRLNVVERILLGRRLIGERPSIARDLADLASLRSPPVDQTRQSFETALLGSALDGKSLLPNEKQGAADTVPPRGGGGGGPATPGPARSRATTGGFRAGGGELGRLQASNGVPGNPGGPPTPTPATRDEVAADAERALMDSPAEFGIDRDANKDVLLREMKRSLYRAPQTAQTYVEQQYWKRTLRQIDASLVTVNDFWLDFALADPAASFLSAHLTAAAGNFTEMMLALAVLDLPFEAGEHQVETTESRVAITADSPMLLVRKDLREAEVATGDSPLLMSQSFFELHDRFVMKDGQRVEQLVQGAFVVDTVYGCQVALTNPSSTPRRLEVLMQIPEGSLPVRSGRRTRGETVELAPWSTWRHEFHFYFPEAGRFSHYPAHAARDGRLVAFAEPRTCDVVTERTEVDTATWRFIARNGALDALYAFLEESNLRQVSLPAIAWRMKDRGVFDSVVERLRQRKVYEPTLWSYGLYHGDVQTTREFLRHQDGLAQTFGETLVSPLLTLDPVQRGTDQFVEFRPLFNSRAHRFGATRRILNDSLASEYREFLVSLCRRPTLRSTDWLQATNYLLVQDRVADALEAFGRVDATALSTRMQYDYTRAYLDLRQDEPRVARQIAEQYASYPVDPWRTRFETMLVHLDEAAGRVPGEQDLDSVAGRQDALAGAVPTLDVEAQDGSIRLVSEHLDQAELRYYAMDVEFLFSSSPFVQQGAGSFSFVQPNLTQTVALTDDVSSHAIPDAFQATNVLVEVRGGGLVQRKAHYANALSVELIESYGQVRVRHEETGAALPRTYVKVFARMPDGSVRFHKDGYTDLRGRFDYASMSGDVGSPSRYAVLVLHEEHGAEIREVAPPLR